MYQQLHTANLPEKWFISFSPHEIQCFTVSPQFQSKNPPLSFSKILLIQQELSWKLLVENHELTTSNSVLSCFPLRLTSKVLLRLLNVVHDANVCTGNFDDCFIKLAQMKNGTFYSIKNQVVAILEQSFCFTVNNERRCGTVRHVNCAILLKQQTRCMTCSNYRNTLRALVSKLSNGSGTLRSSTRVNTRFMKSLQRQAHLAALRRAIQNKNKQLQRLKNKIEKLINGESCVTVDEELSNDLQMIIDQHKVIEKDAFKKIFWEQQVFSMLCHKYNIIYYCIYLLGESMQNNE